MCVGLVLTDHSPARRRVCVCVSRGQHGSSGRTLVRCVLTDASEGSSKGAAVTAAHRPDEVEEEHSLSTVIQATGPVMSSAALWSQEQLGHQQGQAGGRGRTQS